jgi:hypothetical protein
VSAMADMSRAVRHVLEDNSTDRTLKTVPTEVLGQFVAILGAFFADFREEYQSRPDREPTS